MVGELADRKRTDKAARLVELEILPYEGGQLIGHEKEPSLVAFANLLNAKGITKETLFLDDGTLEISFYRRGKLKRVFRIEPKPY
ncbi:hypothetical protein JCM12825_05950 [Desulfurobacterium crinifex]